MKMSLASPIAAVCLYLLTLSLVRADGGFVTVELGTGTIDVDTGSDLPFRPLGNADANTPAQSIGGGFVFPSGIYLDAAFTALETLNLFLLGDKFELTAVKLGAGYAFKASDSINFLGKIGMAFWEFDAREDMLFNPGPEASGKFSGTDVFFEIGGEYVVNAKVSFTLTHARDSFDLGDAHATRIGIRYLFGGSAARQAAVIKTTEVPSRDE